MDRAPPATSGAVILPGAAKVDHVRAEAAELAPVVGDDQDGAALQAGDRVLHRPGGGRVESAGGLVEQEKLGVEGEGAGQAEALALAHAELLGRGVEAVTDLVQEAGFTDGRHGAGPELLATGPDHMAQAKHGVGQDRGREDHRRLADQYGAGPQGRQVDDPAQVATEDLHTTTDLQR